MFRNSDSYRNISCNALHRRYNYGFLLGQPHLSGRQIWVVTTENTCKRSLHVFYLYIFSYGSRSLLWLIYQSNDLKNWGYIISSIHINSFLWLCFAVRTNVILSRDGHYQTCHSCALYRSRHCPVDMGRVLCRQTYPSPILCIPLPLSLCPSLPKNFAPSFFT